MGKKKTKTKRTKVYVLTIRNINGDVIDVFPSACYDDLVLKGMESAKQYRGYWEIFNVAGRRIDGNYDLRFIRR